LYVLDAILARHSVRDFLPTPPPKELVLKMMEAATHGPCGGNSRPWEIFIASGAHPSRFRPETPA
jgi:nitroreductase